MNTSSKTNQPSIAKEGLRSYLDRTKDQHNDLEYADFVRLFDSKVNKSNLARAFNINRKTLTKWLGVYQDEAKA